MNKTIEDISATKKRLTIEVPADAVESEIQNALMKLKKTVNVPGFRKGKVPVSMIEKRYGKEAEAETIDKIIPDYYSRVLKEDNLKPVGQPKLEGQLEFKRHSPFTFTLLVEVMPEIKDLVYEGVRIDEVSVEPQDDDVDKTIERFREEKALFEPAEGPVQDGNIVIMDYELKDDDGEKTFKDEVFKVGSEMMPKEFSDNLIGKQKDEQVEFTLTFPDDYDAKEMAGKKVTISVTLKDIKKVTLPDVDDEFAKDMNFDNLEALKTHVSERLEQSRQDTLNRIHKAAVLKKILKTHEFEAPESLVEKDLMHMMDQAKHKGRTEEDEVLRKEYQDAAERQVKSSILLQIIGDKESITVSEDELKQKVLDLSRRLNLTPENVMKYFYAQDGSLEGLYSTAFEEKVLDLLLERAVIEKGE